MPYSEGLPSECTHHDFREENAQIEALEGYDNLDVRYSPAFGKLVAEIRRRYFKARSSDS